MKHAILIATLTIAPFLPLDAAGVAVSGTPLELLPVQEGGRKKPYSTFAGEALLTMSGKVRLADGTTALDAVTDIWLTPEGWRDRPLILVNRKPLKEELGLPTGDKLFSYQQLASNAAFRERLSEIQNLRSRDRNAKLDATQNEIVRVGNRLTEFEELVSGRKFAFVPNPKSENAKWTTLDRAGEYFDGESGRAVEEAFDNLRERYRAGDREGFAGTAGELAGMLSELPVAHYPAPDAMALEHRYYDLHPFRLAWILYALSAIVLATTSTALRKPGYIAGWLLAGGGFALQLYGFYCRIAISGRPPVTNMYESVIWVAFGCILFALVFEAIYRCRYFLLGAAPVAVVSLILADSQPTVLSSAIDPLVPVLRDNFWLTTHVLSITLSYAAFALALGVAHIALGKILLGRKPSPSLYNYIYRCLQVGVFLLGTGTILGGVWANYSWGRFWDWDPKETWALIAFLCYLIILHGRIAGAWGGFGLAVGSVLAFLSVLMAWYGVNFVLGTGLHSYGFGTGGFPAVIAIVAAEILFVAAAVLRYRVLRQHGRKSVLSRKSRQVA